MTKDSLVFVGEGHPMLLFNLKPPPGHEEGIFYLRLSDHTSRFPERINFHLSAGQEGGWETRYPLQVDRNKVVLQEGRWGVLIECGVISRAKNGYKFGPLRWLRPNTYILALSDLDPYYLKAYDLPMEY